jgi:hypothetical protein
MVTATLLQEYEIPSPVSREGYMREVSVPILR